ncbi:serine O-acetyltransferase EpsC [Francisella adeliensis]|uniref:Serine acetyltransferase n=1 Tax=Francisella adeliensis TaxID=2007306 RepID=A0A2Z4XYV6_9GAMM|nr:serine O-acetyltransferase EpsC [Francisella adeliensis]AXA33613.1 hypothetical protein CDH04_03955 [Francisella adeliensis]MBK2085142.1 serine acetyltransferase [Francisella adeliensis]MBK2097381.1 serine acetyltransferase [Francisella adeliensis]QIW11847.1 serine acetyltransferase [Francisella adeliensis]QIW13723.1 serine acetyltransferase [Francisella adeliensis]
MIKNHDTCNPKDKTNILHLNLDIFLNNAKNILTHNVSKIPLITLDKSKLDLRCQLCNLLESFYLFIREKQELSAIQKTTDDFMTVMPTIEQLIEKDIQSAYERDPSAYNKVEIILCFPGIDAIMMHRISHALDNLNIPILPRMISKKTHEKTSIDIHPKAKIGESFFIDHGAGVVIGETCIVGNFVTLYHGVTLGAKSFPKDENNEVIRGIKRHPNIEDNVTIYSNTTILGDITIGRESIIGANVSITKDIAPKSRVYQQKYKQTTFEDGLGI